MPETALGAARRLSLTALVMTVLVGLQLLLGMVVVGGTEGVLKEIHGGIGYLLLLVSIVGAVFGFQVGRATGAMGRFGHAVAIPVLLLVQIALAEMNLKWVHVVLGLVLVAAIVALWTMSRRPAAPVAS